MRHRSVFVGALVGVVCGVSLFSVNWVFSAAVCCGKVRCVRFCC